MKKVWIGIGGVLVIAAGVALVLFRPVDYHVERSIQVSKTPEETFGVVRDFHQWPAWSPWIKMEPDTEVKVSGDGKQEGDTYRWSGELVGVGEMEHVKMDPPRSLEMEIRFVEPFASTAQVGFRVEPDGENPGGSVATWLMDGKIPSLMKPMMAAWIGMDYDRGLRMLKEYCETGSVLTKSRVLGEVERPALSYVGKSFEGKITEIDQVSDAAFDEVEALLRENGVEPRGRYLAFYSKWDMVGDKVEFMAAYPVKKRPESLPEGVEYVELPAHKAFQVNHEGPFRHVGNGWSTGMQHLRVKKIKQSRKIKPYETIPVNAEEIPETEIVSEIFFPLP